MPVLYVLAVPEYQSLVDYAERRPDLMVSTLGDYRKIEADGNLTIPRKATGLGQAVWFGALVGGFEGTIAEFSESQLVIGT